MGRVTITVADIRRPTEDRKRGGITGTDGTQIGCFVENIGKFQIGQTYDVEVSEGQYPNVRSVKHVAGPPATATPSQKAASNGNGYYRPTAPEDSERMFVCSLMNAFIQAGKINAEQNQVIRAINVLREAYHATFGSDGMRQAAE
jgi:hypothetical protein